MAAASACTELPSGPRRRWRRGQALLKVEAASAGQAATGEDSYQLIEVEVGTDAKFPDRPLNPRHIETIWGRWIVAPDPERRYPLPPGSLRSACFGVAQTRQRRIAVYIEAAPALVLHRDI